MKEMKTMSKAVWQWGRTSIRTSAYAMATTDGMSAEIIMYGDIYESHPVDWWTGNPIEGQFITLDEFLSDLEQISGCQNITIRMNSYGGDAGVSNTIHNRLRELARNGAQLTCVVDGAAMSGGSLIMCACDTVKVNPSSLIMIHKCWVTLWGGYNADELREQAKQQDSWDQMQVEVYKRKTGLSDTVLRHMMADTTYMTGREAVEKGFADEVIEDADPVDIAASADGRSLFVRGRQMHLAPGMFVPDSIPTMENQTVAPGADPVDIDNEDNDRGGGTRMANTVEELRAEYPELTAQMETAAADAANAAQDERIQQAVQAERQRIQDIDAMAALFGDDLVSEAKYGEHPCSAQELAYRAAQAAAKAGTNFLSAMNADNQASGAQNVGAAPGAKEEGKPLTEEEKMKAAQTEVRGLLGKKEA
jgi:ATP-dependent protease ClpP protease subunit